MTSKEIVCIHVYIDIYIYIYIYMCIYIYIYNNVIIQMKENTTTKNGSRDSPGPPVREPSSYT